MEVTVKFFTTLREITGKREEKIVLNHDATVRDLLNILSNKYGKAFGDYVFESSDTPRPSLQFLVDGVSIANLQTKLRNGCKVAIIPPVGGG
ncbi:MoaD family protein [Candidatus Bathyarchaeota archaeon]|nr:MoaD family protein [Candidatus Bathyarchaeota archaeon]